MEKFRHELRTRRRRRGEGLHELVQDVERLAALAYPDHPRVTRDLLGVEVFIEALRDAELTFKVREREPPTLQEALSIAMKPEILCQARTRTPPNLLDQSINSNSVKSPERRQIQKLKHRQEILKRVSTWRALLSLLWKATFLSGDLPASNGKEDSQHR